MIFIKQTDLCKINYKTKDYFPMHDFPQLYIIYNSYMHTNVCTFP